MSLFPSHSMMEYSIYGMVEEMQSTKGSIMKKPRKYPHHCQHKWTHKVSHLSIYSFSDNHSGELCSSENGTKYCNCMNLSPRKPPNNTNAPANVCPNDWLQKKGKCYKFFMNFKSWIDSQKSCSVKKSHLLMIQDKAELDFIQSNIQDGIYFWIGLNVSHPQKTWTWLDGTPLNLQLFQVTGQVEEHACAVITKKGIFSEKCFIQSYWICQEVIPSPSENDP
ncbi:killer cell lectin-like receptor subfamily F member 1 isoform X2 [Oryctolagus cuniculus]|uniref:killer cell lectin-like receptor subfamily F member 1 isoform X2 n=1 Tax=Oryctolagus cuniculus TaxID=9986 RepID=UPI00222E80A5|nr:killer cell lectin-like receptor subfamily F member 1 isoform X2 [Oryctolagus cuniculus]